VTIEENRSKRLDTPTEISRWLVDLLERHGGQMPVRDVERLAAEAGVNKSTLRRARERAGLATWRTGYGPGFGWIVSLHSRYDFHRAEQKVDADRQAELKTSENSTSIGEPERESEPVDPLVRAARAERAKREVDPLEQTMERMTLRGERTMREAARGRAWPACTSCSIPAQWVDELGRCYECAQRGEGLAE
jgi:hypothetical protein